MSDQKIKNDPDFIYAEDFNNSLKKILKNNPDGISDTKVMQYLKISKEDLATRMLQIRERFSSLLK